MNWIRKITMVVLVIIVMASPVSSSLPVYAVDTSIKHIGNGFVDVYVDPQTGRFMIQTDQGNPRRENDANKELLFGEANPKTSFSSFRIDGEDYIFGNHYGFLGMESSFISPSTSYGNVNQTTWTINGLHITQTITLIDDEANENAGNVKISYLVENKANKSMEIGSRILLDTKLGSNDASPIALEGDSTYIQTETELTSDLPQYWRAANDTLAPEVMSYGFLRGWGHLEPDRFIVGHWEGLSETKWDYEVNPALNFTTTRNPYGSADSAVAIYWDPATLAAGEKRFYETYYGLGDLQSSEDAANFDTVVTGPRMLTVNASKDGYLEETFDIHVQIDNTYTTAEELQDVEIDLILPPQLQFSEGSKKSQTFSSIAVNSIKTATWKVKAISQASYTSARYAVRVKAKGIEEVIKANFVLLPSTNGAPPVVQMLDVSPNKKYVADPTHDLTVRGKNLSLLQDNPNVSYRLVRDHDQHVYTILSSAIAINGDQMTVNLDGLWETGTAEAGLYTLKVETRDYGTFEKKFEYTTDEAYQSLQYGLLAVVRNGTQYNLKAFENEENLQKNGDDKLLIFRGDVNERKDDYRTWYEIGKGATINSVVKFERDAAVADWLGLDQKIIVEATKDGVSVDGVGVLSIPSFPFAFGEFSLDLENGTSYTLDPEGDDAKLEITWPMMSWAESQQNMNSMPVKITSAKIGKKDGKDTVSFGGKISLNLGGQQKAVGADSPPTATGDEAGISAELFEARFGSQNGQFGLLGLNAGGEVAMPEDFIPGMTFGAEGGLTFNTFIHEYGLDVSVDFELVELNGSLMLRLTDTNIPVIDKLVFAVGSEPGIPLVPPTVVGYVTKAGGGFENLYDTIMGNYEVLPPLKLILIGDMDLAKVVEASDMELAMSLQGTSFTGSFDIAKIPILKNVYGNVIVKDSAQLAVDVNIGAKLAVLEVIKGQAEATFSYDETRNGIFGPVYLAGSGYVAVVIPSEIPIIGGIEAASVAAELSTEKLYARMALLEIPVAVSYEWGGSVQLEAGSGSKSTLMAQPVYNVNTGDYAGTMRIGTNIHPIETKPLAIVDKSKLSVSMASGGSYIIDVPAHLDHLIFELPLTSMENPNPSIIDPSGNPYTLSEFDGAHGNYRIQRIPADVSQSGEEEFSMYVTVTGPEGGTWEIHTDRPLKSVPKLYEVEGLPTIQNVNETLSSDEVTVHWDTENVEDHMGVAIYLTEDNNVPRGDEADPVKAPSHDVLVITPSTGIKASDGTATFTVPETLPSGNYYVKTVLVENDTNLHHSFSSHPLKITNELEPDRPLSVTADAIGNGFVQVDWTTGSEDEIDGFIIEVLDENGNHLPDTGAVFVQDASKKSGNIGGVFTNAETGEKLGILPGEKYKVAVSSYRQWEKGKIYSQPVISSVVEVPVIQSPQIDIEVDGTVRALDMDRKVVYQTTENRLTVSVSSDQMVTADLYLNSKFLSTHKGESFSYVIELESDGEHILEVRAVNEQGDMTVESIRLSLDTVAPDLKLDSKSVDDGHVEVFGVAEMGSTLYVDGAVTPLEPDGSFSTSIDMENHMSKNIDVRVVDLFGNQTVKSLEVFNQQLPAFERIKLRASSKEEKESGLIEMKAGESETFLVYGVADDGSEYVIDTMNVDWEILSGHGLGQISDEAELSAVSKGKLVVKASYSVSDSYALEDAMIVDVNGQVSTTDPDEDKGGKRDDSVNDEDEIMEQMLRQLLESEGDIEFIGFQQLSDHQGTMMQLGDTAYLWFPGDSIWNGLGVGVGRVINPEKYLTGAMEFIGDIFEMKMSEKVQFEQKPILTFKLSSDYPKDISKLHIYWYNEQKNRWEFIGGDYDRDNNTISSALPHFSKYALLYNPDFQVFEDMENRWSANSVYRLSSMDIIHGYQENGKMMFKPSQKITRQEFLKILVGATEESVSDPSIPNIYKDANRVGEWAKPYFSTALSKEWLYGYQENGDFYLKPTQEITRAEIATLMYRILKDEIHVNESNVVHYRDVGEFPAYAVEAIKALSSNGMMSGYPDGTFGANQSATREEVASLIQRMLDWKYQQ